MTLKQAFIHRHSLYLRRPCLLWHAQTMPRTAVSKEEEQRIYDDYCLRTYDVRDVDHLDAVQDGEYLDAVQDEEYYQMKQMIRERAERVHSDNAFRGGRRHLKTKTESLRLGIIHNVELQAVLQLNKAEWHKGVQALDLKFALEDENHVENLKTFHDIFVVDRSSKLEIPEEEVVKRILIIRNQNYHWDKMRRHKEYDILRNIYALKDMIASDRSFESAPPVPEDYREADPEYDAGLGERVF